jgi:hypothetical protein
MAEHTKKQASTRLNQLIQTWPRGSVSVAVALKKQGFNSNLLHWYKSSKWLDSVGRGAYKLHGDQIDWYGGLFALQKQLGLSIHAGGKTALFLRGYAHFISDTLDKVSLFGQRNEKLPGWFIQYPWDVNVEYQATDFLPTPSSETLSQYTHREFAILISAPERAVFEMLYQVPRRQTFDEALLIMENLTTLRSELMQQLLQSCRSVR